MIINPVMITKPRLAATEAPALRGAGSTCRKHHPKPTNQPPQTKLPHQNKAPRPPLGGRGVQTTTKQTSLYNPLYPAQKPPSNHTPHLPHLPKNHPQPNLPPQKQRRAVPSPDRLHGSTP